MTKEQRAKEFLQKAEEAEEQADKAKGATERDTWLKIAASYRELAKDT